VLVRRGERSDVEPASATLAAAFTGYAWTDWTIAADDQERRSRRSFELILEHAIVPFGELWVTDECTAVAVWLPPGSDSVVWPALDAIEGELRELAGDRAEEGAAAESETSRLRLDEPHWFLAAVGTRPEQQRQGLGSAVLWPVLERAAVAQLETVSKENIAFYRTLGFSTVDELDISHGGPRVWSLVRRGQLDSGREALRESS
jgi:GNAT superfamily N-acetyltransferase